MKFLFVHQNFPGQFVHLIRDLARTNKHEIICITNANDNRITGVRKLVYPKPSPDLTQTHPHARDLDLASRHAEAVATLARNLRGLGFVPDLIIGHPGWGEMLHLSDVFPNTPQLAYFEFFYRIIGADVGFDPEFPTAETDLAGVRNKNVVNLLTLNNGVTGQTPTKWQRSTYPDWAQKQITLLPEGVNLETCKPDAKIRKGPITVGDITVAPHEKLLTYVARNIEPYRGCHIFIRALPALLRARPDLRVIMVGGHEQSYGPTAPPGGWAEKYLAEIPRIDRHRLHMPGKIDYADYMRILQRSDAHVYLTFPFVASWSLREALACGARVIGSDTAPVSEFITHGKNGLLTPFHDQAALAKSVLDLLESPRKAQALSRGAREYAEQNLDLADHITAYHKMIRKLTH